MKQPNRWPGLVLLTALMLAGCMHDGPSAFDETVESRIILKLPHAAAFEGALQECSSVVLSVVLAIDGRPLPSQPAELGGQASFFAEVNVGLVAFAVEIFSNNETVLFAGSTRQMIERDGFVVDLTPTPVNPVLQVCIEPGRRSFEIHNRGSRVLAWRIIPPPDRCGIDPPRPCVVFDPESGDVPSGGFSTVFFGIAGNEAGPFEARVTSAVGDISFEVTGQGAAAPREGHAARATFLLNELSRQEKGMRLSGRPPR